MAGMKFLSLPLSLLSLAALVASTSAADLAPARALLAKKDFPAAVTALEAIAQAEPANADAHLLLGNALSGQIADFGLLTRARLAKRSLAAYERAAALDSRHVGARLALVQYYQQAPFIVGGSRAKAYTTARELALLDAWHGNFWLMRLHLEDKQIAEAFAACDALLQAEPSSYRALYQLGRTVAVSGQHPARGAAALRQAVTLTPSPADPALQHAYHRLGQILAASGDFLAARAAFEQALVLDPKLAEAAPRLAQLK
jgi:tetratricopeptide (TPR) repeat protein